MPRKSVSLVEDDDGPSKAWLESYADAMTLLLAFFIMMFAFALVDESKFYDFKVGMVTALGTTVPIADNAESILGQGQGIAPTLGDNLSRADEVDIGPNPIVELGRLSEGTITRDNAEEIRRKIEEAFVELGAGEYVAVEVDQRGVVIRFDDRILFASGSAEFGPDAPLVLTAAAQAAATVDNPIEVEGHTDNVPTNPVSQYPTNWELSGARASRVVRFMLESATLAPSRVATIGLADTKPRDTNDTDAGRARNRRVEVVLRVDGLGGDSLQLVEPFDLLTDPVDTEVPAQQDPAAEGEKGADATDEEPAP